jgi:hypothetical protein
MVLRVKKLSITNFVTNYKSKAHSILTFKKKKDVGALKWNYDEFIITSLK